jgi:hypothetical protein
LIVGAAGDENKDAFQNAESAFATKVHHFLTKVISDGEGVASVWWNQASPPIIQKLESRLLPTCHKSITILNVALQTLAINPDQLYFRLTSSTSWKFNGTNPMPMLSGAAINDEVCYLATLIIIKALESRASSVGTCSKLDGSVADASSTLDDHFDQLLDSEELNIFLPSRWLKVQQNARHQVR